MTSSVKKNKEDSQKRLEILKKRRAKLRNRLDVQQTSVAEMRKTLTTIVKKEEEEQG